MFTPDPRSTIIPGSSRPLIITLIVGLLMSTTVGPSSRFEKNVEVGVGLDGANADFNSSLNRDTSCSNRPNGNVIWHSYIACHVGFSSCVFSVGSSIALLCSFISVTFRLLDSSIHSVVCFGMASCDSHSAIFPFDLVVTCCMSATSATTMLIADHFSLFFTGHWWL